MQKVRAAGMTEEAKAARRAYKKQWRANNKDKIKASTARYWERKAKQAEEEERQRTEEGQPA